MFDRSLWAIFGGIAGSLITYLIMKKEFDSRMHEEYQAMEEHFRKKYEPDAKKAKKPVNNEEPKKEEKVVLLNASEKVRKDEAPTDYTAYHKEEGKEERMISLITSERFNNEEPEYEKVTLSYYEEDEILADGFGDIVDLETTIGEKAVSYFGMLHQEVIYIRNDQFKIDYEVVLEHSAYGDMYENGFR